MLELDESSGTTKKNGVLSLAKVKVLRLADELEEPVDNPGTTIGTVFRVA